MDAKVENLCIYFSVFFNITYQITTFLCILLTSVDENKKNLFFDVYPIITPCCTGENTAYLTASI